MDQASKSKNHSSFPVTQAGFYVIGQCVWLTSPAIGTINLEIQAGFLDPNLITLSAGIKFLAKEFKNTAAIFVGEYKFYASLCCRKSGRVLARMGTRVILFPLPVQGHIIPMLHLAECLASHGLTVTFITTHDTHSRVLETMIEIMADPPNQMLNFVSIPTGAEHKPKATTGMDAIWQVMFSMHRLQGEFESLLQGILDRGHPVACLISDFLMDWTQDAAAKFEIPRAAFWTSSATYLLLMHHTQELLAEGFIPLKEESAKRNITCVQGIPKLRAIELPFALHVENPADPGFQICAASFTKQLEGPSWILVNTFDELEQEAISAMSKICDHFLPLGPLLASNLRNLNSDEPTATRANDRAILEWLDSKQPASVLYVSFGSVASLQSLQQLEELVLGLQTSRQFFLWVVRTNLVEGVSEEMIENFKARTAGRGLFVPWAPQLQVLQHVAIGGFLTHCGWNSVLESIWMGVPMLGWPCMADQNLNCKFITDIWKIGLKFDSIKCDEIASAIARLMEGDVGKDLRRRMLELRNASQSAVTEGGSSNKNLQAFLEALKKCQN